MIDDAVPGRELYGESRWLLTRIMVGAGFLSGVISVPMCMSLHPPQRGDHRVHWGTSASERGLRPIDDVGALTGGLHDVQWKQVGGEIVVCAGSGRQRMAPVETLDTLSLGASFVCERFIAAAVGDVAGLRRPASAAGRRGRSSRR